MAQNYIEPGDVINYQNASTAITAGSVVKMGTLIGIALVDIPATTGKGAVMVEGVFGPLAKETGQAWAQGDALYWDAANSRFTKTTTSNTFAGYAFEPAASGDAVGYVKLYH
jgi:predicted RecA/RadA family phage recombinase